MSSDTSEPSAPAKHPDKALRNTEERGREERESVEVEADDQTGSVLQQTRAYQFVGPLPDPEHLKRYDEILPGAAERIFGSWERQSKHRQRLEARAQWFALTIALAAIFVGGLCAYFDQPFVGAGIAIAGVASVSVTALIRLLPRSG